MRHKGSKLYKNIRHNKQSGFTILELIVVIIVISILGLFAIDRIFSLRIAAERASVKQLVGTIKSALGLEVARLALKGNMPAVAKLNKSNPILLLSQVPNNYLGEKESGKNINQTGVWYFNKKQQALVYNVPYHENFETRLKGVPRIRYRVKLIYNDKNKNKRFDIRFESIAGLDFFPIEKYHWSVKSISDENY